MSRPAHSMPARPDASDLSLVFGLPLRNRDTTSTFAGLSSM